MSLFQSRHAVGPGRLTLYGITGISIGLILGYIFMASTHAILEIGAENHYSERKAIVLPRTEELETATMEQYMQAAQNEPKVQEVKPVEDPPTKEEKKTDWLNYEPKVIPGSDTWPTTGDTIHVIMTSNGSPYLNIQGRIMYGTYQKMKSLPGGEKFVAFTRLLHRTKDDVLMNHIPTYRVEPHDPQCDIWCWFPVADRPGAIRQFMEAAAKDPTLIKAPWLLLLEGDYVWKKPLQAPMAESSAKSIGFLYNYIDPSFPSVAPVVRKMFPEEKGELTDIPRTGPAPVLLRPDELRRLVPHWERLTYYIEETDDVKETLGWVREMYAFSIAAALENVKLDVKMPPDTPMMVQPPADNDMGNASLFHYTWGSQFLDGNDTKIFEFDKRVYVEEKDVYKVPLMPIPPPFQEGWKTQDGKEVDRGTYEVLKDMLMMMNKAIWDLPVIEPKAVN